MKSIIATILAVAFLTSCATMGLDPADIEGNHARARFITYTYNAAYTDYQMQAALPNLRPEAIEVLKAKRALLFHMSDPIYGPVAIFNNWTATGQVITDTMFEGVLLKLLELETGFYTDAAKMQTFTLKGQGGAEVQDAHLKRAIAEAGLAGPEGAKNPAFIISMIELLRVGIHAIRAILSQRNLDEAQMIESWQAEYDIFKTLDRNALIVLE